MQVDFATQKKILYWMIPLVKGPLRPFLSVKLCFTALPKWSYLSSILNSFCCSLWYCLLWKLHSKWKFLLHEPLKKKTLASCIFLHKTQRASLPIQRSKWKVPVWTLEFKKTYEMSPSLGSVILSFKWWAWKETTHVGKGMTKGWYEPSLFCCVLMCFSMELSWMRLMIHNMLCFRRLLANKFGS